MREIGKLHGYVVSWSDPASDGGRGTGEVGVGLESVSKELNEYARTKEEALRIAEKHINRYRSRM